MARLVQQYSTSWEEKGEVLKKLRTEYETKQRQLSIAVRTLEKQAVKGEQIERERKLNNWMKLYTKVMSSKSTGRRWKFRIEPFRKKLSEGYNPYFSEESDTDDEEDELHEKSLTKSDVELKDLANELSLTLTNSEAKKEQEHPISPDVPVQNVVETAEASTWTDEPQYDNYLMVVLYRPKELLLDDDIVCTLTSVDQFFSSKPYKPNEEEPQTFTFKLSDEAVTYLPPLLKDDHVPDVILTPKINIAVFPRNLANDICARCPIMLSDMPITGSPYIVVPPTESSFNEESGQRYWEPNWMELESRFLSEEIDPVQIPLRMINMLPDDDEDKPKPHILLISQWIKSLRHNSYQTSTCTVPFNELVKEMGYRPPCEVQSRAASAFSISGASQSSPVPEVVEENEERISLEEMAQLTLKHSEDLKRMQEQYDKKLQELSRTLSKVKQEKQRQIEDLEQALMHSEQSRGKRFKSLTDMRQRFAQKRALSKSSLPLWGQNWPEDFFERMELFAHENLRKHAELTHRIREEVQETCEQQLSALHRLVAVNTTDTAMNDLCLPAIFMPTYSSRPLVYNPRAHSYFHPPGSLQERVTQPPAIFKLPSLKSGMQLSTVNLYELSKRYPTTSDSDWHHHSPQLTPAPPPSACDHYSN
jgi:hypothetical protein